MATQIPLYWDATNQVPRRYPTGDSVAIEHGGTGATTQSGARTALGLAIGTDVQAYDEDLAAIVGVTGAGMLVRTSDGNYTVRSIGSGTGITVTNPAGTAGNPSIALATLADGGGGALLKFTRDTYGRVSGTSAVGLADLAPLLDAEYATIENPTFTGTVTLGQDPTLSLQAATKQYVDNLFASGGMPPFSSVLVMANSNLSLSGPATVDTIVLANGNRVLANAQTTASQNGIYVVNTAGAWTRATDADTGAEFAPARQVFVSSGATYANTGWGVALSAAPALGTDPISFTQVSGAASYSNGNGLTLTGTVFAVQGVAGQITVTGGGVGLTTTGVAAGTYSLVTVDTFGRVTAGDTLDLADIGAQAASAKLDDIVALTAAGFLYNVDGTNAQLMNFGNTASINLDTSNIGSGTLGFTLNNTAVTPGTYNSVTVGADGRVTAGTVSSTTGNAVALTNGEAGAIAIGRAVYSSASGEVRLANANNTSTCKAVGLVAATSISAAASGNIITKGILTATTTQWDAVAGSTGGLTYNAVYYLSNTVAGAITTTPPTSGMVVRIGIAVSTTQLDVNPEVLAYL